MTTLMSDTLTKITPALVKAKQQFKPAVRDSTNPHFKSKFVSLDGVIEAIDAALLANGIVVLQPTRLEDGKTVLVTTLLHESGEWLSGEYPVTVAKTNDPQAEGSGLTYARRYALMAMVGIAPEDDDGNAATRPAKPQAAVDPTVDLGELALDFQASMETTTSMAELSELGAKLAASPLTGKARDDLRSLYTERMKALKAAS